MRKILHIGILILTFVILSAACSEIKEVSIGRYCADGDRASIIINDENEMMITGPKEVSATFTGTYIIEDSKLILTLAEQEEYVFSIHKEGIAFESGQWMENWVETGTMFYLSEE